ncbi:tetratricopeptide repeat protein [Alkalicoccus urumqiensis]|nr:tetratricopeptide repeat protein [Alkalicoccus urumqiensis]
MSQLKSRVVPFMREGSYFYKKGIEAYQGANPGRAAKLIRKAVKLDPDEPVFLCQLAIVLAEQGELEEANRCLRWIQEELDPLMSESYFFLAHNLAQLGELEKAEEHLQTYLEMNPEGEFAEDAEMMLEMTEEDSDVRPSTPFFAPGMMLMHEGAFSEAEKWTRAKLAEEPKRFELYALLAESLWRQGEKEKAEDIVHQLMVRDKLDMRARCLYAVYQYEAGAPAGGQEIEELKKLRPFSAWDRYVLGRSLYFAEAFEEAYHFLRTSVPMDDPVYMHQLAAAAAHAEKWQQAEKIWNQAAAMETEKKQKLKELKTKAASGGTFENHRDEWIF